MNYYLFKQFNLTTSPVCGLAMLNPGWCHMKRRLESESVLIIGKKNTTLIDDEGTRLEVKPGRMILLPARHLHKGMEAITKPVSYYWIHFYQCLSDDDELRYFLPKQIEEQEALTILRSKAISYQRMEDSIILPQQLDLENSAAITNMCTAILSEHAKPSFSPLVYNHLVQSLLLELCAQSFDSVQKTKRRNSEPSLAQQVVVLLEDELSNPDVSVKYLANRLEVNADYLGRSFKDVMHASIGQYIIRRRVELSCMRLRETNSGIEEIAKECGFGSRRQFYEEFKRVVGKTPASYRTESAYIGINSL